MTKETIHYSCGHTGVKDIKGNTDYRKNQVKYYERGVCPECYKKEQERKAKEEQIKLKLPDLTGTPKQIAWAESIRNKQYTQIKTDLLTHYSKLSDAIVDKQKWQSGFNKKIIEESIPKHLTSFINSKTHASYWIDNRGSITPALKELYTAVNKDVEKYIEFVKSEQEKDKKKQTRKSKLSTTKKLITEGKIKKGFVKRLGVKRQTRAGTESNTDKKRLAMLPGYRVSKTGKLYKETRQNRSDTPKQRKEVNAYLERKNSKRIPVAKHTDKYKPVNIKKNKK